MWSFVYLYCVHTKLDGIQYMEFCLSVCVYKSYWRLDMLRFACSSLYIRYLWDSIGGVFFVCLFVWLFVQELLEAGYVDFFSFHKTLGVSIH